MADIQLREAQVIWDHEAGDDPDRPQVKVVGGRVKDDDSYSASWGACNSEFSQASELEQLLLLFEKFQELVTVEGIGPKTVHEAFCVIPEYRASCIWRGLGDTIPAHLRDEEGDEALADRMGEERDHQPPVIA